MLMKNVLAKIALLLTLLASVTTLTTSASWAADGHGGSWSKKSQSIAGSWSITGNILTLSDDFKTRSAPDLKIFLSSTPLAQLNGRNATNNSLFISALQSASGAQQYQLPQGLDLSQFKSIIIHCEQYAKLWGGSAL